MFISRLNLSRYYCSINTDIKHSYTHYERASLEANESYHSQLSHTQMNWAVDRTFHYSSTQGADAYLLSSSIRRFLVYSTTCRVP